MSDYTFKKISHDTNGNPRYVCHYMALLSEEEKIHADINSRYEIALAKSRALGGKKYHNKSFGGGIAFVSFNVTDLKQSVDSIANV